MTTIAVIFTNYGPYHLARMEAFHRLASSKGWNVIGVELARTELKYPWQANVSTLPYPFISVFDQPLETIPISKLVWQLRQVLGELRPDVLAMAGYAELPMLATLFWSRWHRKPTILLSATKEDDAPRSYWSEQIKRQIVQQYCAALVGGKPQRQYLEKLGLSAERVFTGYNTVGIDDFHPSRIRHLPRLHSGSYFLAINRFVGKKNLSMLISAYASYRAQAGSQAWDLVICGDGELRAQIEQQITTLKLNESVHLPGFLQQKQLMPYLAHAQCFIHTSLQEQWGLVINEAMAAGLPVLVSDRCGCFEDLVIEGVNGFGFDPTNTAQLSALMLKVSRGQIDLQAMSDAALSHIQQFSPNRFAQGLASAVNQALQVV